MTLRPPLGAAYNILEPINPSLAVVFNKLLLVKTGMHINDVLVKTGMRVNDVLVETGMRINDDLSSLALEETLVFECIFAIVLTR